MKLSGKTIYNEWVFRLIIINVIIYALQLLTDQVHVTFISQGIARSGPSAITYYLGLTPALIFEKGYIWQIFSYMFLHDVNTLLHLVFNMYALYIFGVPIENVWGGKRFILYYLFCGIFAGLSIFIINLISQGLGYYIPTIGASGAVFGLLLAFGILFPDIQLLLFFIIPIKAKYLVILYGGIELFMEFTGESSSISHIGHLGGIVAGLLFFFFINRRIIKFKIKKVKIKEKSVHESLIGEKQKKKMNANDTGLQIKILKKLKEGGMESLSDDEIQYIKYIEIMAGKMEDITVCNELDLDIEDQHCQNCDNFRICFLREVKKYS